MQSFKDACDGESLPSLAEPPREFAGPAPGWAPERLSTLKEAEEALIAEARQALNKRLIRRGPAEE